MRAMIITALLALGLGGAAVAQDRTATTIPLDGEQTVGGVAAACTGVGQTKLDPHWRAYSVRIEFSDPRQDYLANEAVAVFDASGRRLAAVACEGPWILFKLPAGGYRATGWLPGGASATASARFRAPATGQLRVVLRFP